MFRYDNTATAWSQHAILTRNIKDLYMARAVTLRGDVLAVSADGYQNRQGTISTMRHEVIWFEMCTNFHNTTCRCRNYVLSDRF